MIQILSYKKVSDGKKIGFIDVLYKSEIVFRGIVHLKNEKGSWFSWASKAVEMTDGTKQYVPHAQLYDAAKTKEFWKALEEAIKDHQKFMSLDKNEIPF